MTRTGGSSRSVSYTHLDVYKRQFLTRIAHGLVVNLWRRRDLEHAYLQALAQRPEASVPSPERRALVLLSLIHI